MVQNAILDVKNVQIVTLSLLLGQKISLQKSWLGNTQAACGGKFNLKYVKISLVSLCIIYVIVHNMYACVG